MAADRIARACKSGPFGIWFRVACFLFLIAGQDSAQAQVPAWQPEGIKAIARIESQRCLGGSCIEMRSDALARSGTGFLVRLPQFRSPVILTALHVIAGATNITYQFTEVDQAKVPARVVSIDLGADVAVLAPDERHANAIRPLTFGQLNNEKRDILVYGHKFGAPTLISDEGKIKLKSPDLLSGMPFGAEERALIRALGYPDLDLPVIGIEGVLNPGDSGAPVFNVDGQVVGMAHGGIQSSNARIAWMIPAARLGSLRADRATVEKLKEFATKHVFLAVGTFYSTTPIRKTTFGTNPALSFAFQWPITVPPLRPYAARLAAKSALDFEWLNERRGKVRGTRLILPTEDAFPASTADPPNFSCASNPSNVLCASSRRREQRLIDVFSALSVRVACYRSDTIDRMIASSGANLPTQEDLALEMPIGDFKRRAVQDELSLAYQSYQGSTSQLYLSTKGFFEYKLGTGRYTRHPNIEYLEDLYGGACELTLRSTDRRFDEDIAALENGLRTGGACLHLVLAPNTHTPVWATAHLPLGTGLVPGKLWGVLPLGHETGTIDDRMCQ